jgi:WD40 repeat protein
MAKGKEKVTRKGPDEVLTVAFSPDRKALASGSDDNRIILWDVKAGSKKLDR